MNVKYKLNFNFLKVLRSACSVENIHESTFITFYYSNLFSLTPSHLGTKFALYYKCKLKLTKNIRSFVEVFCTKNVSYFLK